MSEQLTPEAEPDNDEQRELAAWLKLKRKAVRERNEAREEVAHWKTEYEIVVARLCGKKHPRDNGIISEHEIIPKLTQERDEALELVSELKRKISDYCDEQLRLVFENRRLHQERDEAREALENHMASTVHSCSDECKRPVCVLRRERDEARKEAEYYKERYEQIKDQYGR